MHNLKKENGPVVLVLQDKPNKVCKRPTKKRYSVSDDCTQKTNSLKKIQAFLNTNGNVLGSRF